MKVLLFFAITCLLQITFAHFHHEHPHHDPEHHPHHDPLHRLHEIFDRCSTCEIKWVSQNQVYKKGPNNSRICRVKSQRSPGTWYAGGLYSGGNGQLFCQIAAHNTVHNMFEFEVLTINAKEIRTISTGPVRDLPDENWSVKNEGKQECSRPGLHEILEEVLEHHDRKHNEIVDHIKEHHDKKHGY